MKNQPPIAIELFAGAGGLALGIEQAGFRTRALVEIDPHCCSTLRANRKRHFPNARVIKADIRELNGADIRKRANLGGKNIALVAGGPPCQSFSIAKESKGGRRLDDERDLMVLHFARLVSELEPDIFLMENVPGLLSKAQGRIFQELLHRFGDIGYSVRHSILNSANYGAPQLRRRLIILGSRKGTPPPFPEPTHSPMNNLSGLPKYATIGEALSPVRLTMPNMDPPRHTPQKVAKLASILPGSSWSHWRYRDRWDGPSRCITGHCRDDWVHPLEPRAGTVRELAALQTFPLDYVFKGPISELNNHPFHFQYRQVGNAVPVVLAKAIGDQLLHYIYEGEALVNR